MPEFNAYGVVGDKGLEIATVSPTRRAAIVNWLVTHGDFVSQGHTDNQIEARWEAQRFAGRIKPKYGVVTVLCSIVGPAHRGLTIHDDIVNQALEETSSLAKDSI